MPLSQDQIAPSLARSKRLNGIEATQEPSTRSPPSAVEPSRRDLGNPMVSHPVSAAPPPLSTGCHWVADVAGERRTGQGDVVRGLWRRRQREEGRGEDQRIAPRPAQFASSLIRTSAAVDEEDLVSPPVALTLHVVARILAEIGRTEDEDLEALRPALVASPRSGRDAHHVPLLELDDLVVELHPPAPARDHVHLLLVLMRVAVREAIVGRDALIAQAGLLELEGLACEAELQVRRAVEVGPEILQILPEVPERERHGRDSTVRSPSRRARWVYVRRTRQDSNLNPSVPYPSPQSRRSQ